MVKDFELEIKTFLLVALIAIILSVAGVFLLRGTTPESSPQTLDTSDFTLSPSTPLGINSVESWQTYRSEEFGFQFEYPARLKTIETPTNHPIGLHISLDKGGIVVQEIDNSIVNINVPEDCMFHSGALEEKNSLSFTGTKEVNGINFYHYKNYPNYIGGYCGMSTGCHYKDIYRALHNGQCYQIVYGRSDRSFIEGDPYSINPKIIGDVKEIPEVFDQILSTFRFIDGE